MLFLSLDGAKRKELDKKVAFILLGHSHELHACVD